MYIAYRSPSSVVGPCGRDSSFLRASSENSFSTEQIGLRQLHRRDLPVLQQRKILEPLLLVRPQLVDDSLQLADVGDERLAAGFDIRRRDGRDPALPVGVVQRAVDREQPGQPLAQLVEPDVAQRLRVVLGRARILHLRRHAADRHAAGQQRQQRVPHRVVRQRRLGHRHRVRIRESPSRDRGGTSPRGCSDSPTARRSAR